MTIKPIIRWFSYILLFFIVIILIAALVIRFVIFPNIDDYKVDIAQHITESLGQKVSIGDITTGWSNLSPQATLGNITLYDKQNRPALTLKEVDTELSWLSVGLLDFKLSKLVVKQPELTVRRNAGGEIFLAGISLNGEGDGSFANWLLNQQKVKIERARVKWIDEQRKAPELSLNQLNLTLTSSAWKSLLGKHQFYLSALPSIGLKKPISTNGYFIGKNTSNIKDWYGEMHLSVQSVDLGIWQPWVSLPVNLQNGQGDLEASLHFSKQKIDRIIANVNLDDVLFSSEQQTKPLRINNMNGTLGWSDDSKKRTLTAKHFSADFDTGVNIQDATGIFTTRQKHKKTWVDSRVELKKLTLSSLRKTSQYFVLPKVAAEYINKLSPVGNINNLKTSFSGPIDKPNKYSVSAELDNLGIASYNKIPGFDKLSGSLLANQNKGSLSLNSNNTTIDAKDILRWPIKKNRLKGQVNWVFNQANKAKITINNLQISNPEIYGSLNGTYDTSPKKGHYIDLKGNFPKGNAKYAPHYYPVTLNQSTLKWLDSSILKGNASNINLVLKGGLSNFPFLDKNGKPNPKLGIFKVTARIDNGTLNYGNSWPNIEDLGVDLVFENTRMDIYANKGRIMDKRIIKSHAAIAKLNAASPMLTVVSDAEGTVPNGIAFINNSPVKEVMLGFTDGLQTEGNGLLHLDLTIPLKDVDGTQYKGSYQITQGSLIANENIGMPKLGDVNGALNFDNTGINGQNIKTQIVGGPATFSIATKEDNSLQINAKGQATSTGIQDFISLPLLSHAKGGAEWSGDINIKKPLANIKVTSNLVGVSSDLPAPFKKLAETNTPLNIEKTQTKDGEDTLNIQYGESVSTQLMRESQNDTYTVKRGAVNINAQEAALLPDTGINITANLDAFNVATWLDILKQEPELNHQDTQQNSALINQANITVNKLNLFDRELEKLSIKTTPTASGFKMAVSNKAINGNAEWIAQGNGKLIATLDRLIIPASSNQVKKDVTKEKKRLAKQYPALDITVNDFQMGDKNFGKLRLNAYEQDNSWVIQQMNMTNPVYTITAKGVWHNWTHDANTFINFQLDSHDLGKTLRRFGQPKFVKQGKASVSGSLQWPGSPHEFEKTGLNGDFTVKASKGQILKVQPGVGRLLGLLSLQSLPRRLTLDFRDLFSDGFAFDKISATATAKNGVLNSDDFVMTGSAADTEIEGQINLAQETQDLTISIKPNVSDTLSLAAFAGGPVAGIAAFIAQKLLKDPLNKIAETEYVITGTWDDPQEVAAPKPAQPQEKSILVN